VFETEDWIIVRIRKGSLYDSLHSSKWIAALACMNSMTLHTAPVWSVFEPSIYIYCKQI